MGCIPSPQDSRYIQATDEERLVFEFQHRSCFGTPKGLLNGHVMKYIPQQMQQRGISQQQWIEWMDKLEQIQKGSTSMCTIYLMAIPTLGFCFGLFPLSKYLQYQKDMREWQELINNEIQTKGMYVKTQTMIVIIANQRIEKATLSIALNQQESEQLQREPHLVFPNCCTCCQWFEQYQPPNCYCPIDRDRVI